MMTVDVTDSKCCLFNQGSYTVRKTENCKIKEKFLDIEIRKNSLKSKIIINLPTKNGVVTQTRHRKKSETYIIFYFANRMVQNLMNRILF